MNPTRGHKSSTLYKLTKPLKMFCLFSRKEENNKKKYRTNLNI